MAVHVGELLQEWRRRRKQTCERVASQAGISRTTLARWESGQTQPRITELEAVLTALAVSPAQRQEALAYVNAPRAAQRLRDLTGSAGPPVRGDLLRALRLRQGWTQQDTAQRAGVAQSTLARWERSEDWPSTERLHALCYALRAKGAELAALTQGRMTAIPNVQTMQDREAGRAIVAHNMFYSSLPDLEFLSLEAQWWRIAQTETAAHLELSYTYGCHARFLAERHRYAEAAAYVERVHLLAKSGFRDDIGWSASVIAEARNAGRGRGHNAAKRAAKILRTGIDSPFLRERVEYRAWMQSELALYLLKMGEADSARLLSRQAIQMAERVDDAEPWWRRLDYARMLLEVGHPNEALGECSAYLSLGLPIRESLPFIQVGAQALRALGRETEAMEWRGRADAIMDSHPDTAHFRASAETLPTRQQAATEHETAAVLNISSELPTPH